MKNLYFILHKNDWPRLQKRIHKNDRNYFVIWYVDITSKEREAMKVYGEVLEAESMIETIDRHKIDRDVMSFLNALNQVGKETLSVQDVALPHILTRNLKFLCTLHEKLRHVLGRIHETIDPDSVVLVRRAGLTYDILRHYFKAAHTIRYTEVSEGVNFKERRARLLKGRLGFCYEVFKWMIRCRYRQKCARTLDQVQNIIFLCNVTDHQYQGVIRQCHAKGWSPLKIGKKRHELKHDSRYIFLESFYAGCLWRASLMKTDLKSFWRLLDQWHPEYADEYWAPLRRGIHREIQRRKFEIYLNAICLDRLFSHYDVCLVFLWNDNLWWERLFVEIARKHHIPSFCYQHGIWGYQAKNYVPFAADWIGVWGPMGREQLADRVVHQDQIICVGCPALERIYHNGVRAGSSADNDAINKVLYVALPETWTRVHSAVLPYDEGQKLFDCVLEAFDDLDNVELIVKTRGQDETNLYKRWLEGSSYRSHIRFCDQRSIVELIREANVIISYYSTAILEAMALHRPVILLDILAKPQNCLYARKDSVLMASNSEDLKNSLRMLLENKNASLEFLTRQGEAFLKEYIDISPLPADERLGNALADIAQKGTVIREKVHSPLSC